MRSVRYIAYTIKELRISQTLLMDEPIPFNQNETGAGGENTVSHTNCAELTEGAFIIYERGGGGWVKI